MCADVWVDRWGAIGLGEGVQKFGEWDLKGVCWYGCGYEGAGVRRRPKQSSLSVHIPMDHTALTLGATTLCGDSPLLLSHHVNQPRHGCLCTGMSGC